MMAFNPDDFVFEQIKPPEINPTILEYDAKLKLILLRSRNLNDTGEYTYQACVISEEVNNNLLANIPEKWNNRNDKIALFYIRENGDYVLEREKLKYDFKTQTSKWIRYSYDSFTLEDAKELFEILKSIIWVQNTLVETSKSEQLLELAKKQVYLDRMHLERIEKQNQLLRDSDWRVIDDAPSSYQNEKEMWVEWRKQLREIVKSPSEFEDELSYLIYHTEFKWPINPDQYHDLDPNHEILYLSNDKHWSNFLDVSITNEKVSLVNSQVNETISRIKSNMEEGIPITRQMANVIKRYNLIDNTILENLQFKEVNDI